MSLDVIGWIKGWRLDKVFQSFKDHADKIAVTITQLVKTTLDSNIVNTITSLIDDHFKTHLAEDVVNTLKAISTKALALELGIQQLPDNPTEEEIKIFGELVVKAITGLDPSTRSKFYTTFAASIYGAFATDKTFAELVIDVESAFHDLFKNLSDNP